MKITVENLSKNFGECDTLVRALKSCSFSIADGERVAVIGSSGSGKTTLLNIIGGLDAPTEGKVMFDDKPLPFDNQNALANFRLRNIGRVFQSYDLIPELTAYENIIIPTLLKGDKPDKNYLYSIINMLGMENRLKHYPSQLSGGQQQRVAIARALANKPSVILCDEPTGNLDNESTETVISLLKTTADELKFTLVTVTHDSKVAGAMDRIITIDDGVVTA